MYRIKKNNTHSSKFYDRIGWDTESDDAHIFFFLFSAIFFLKRPLLFFFLHHTMNKAIRASTLRSVKEMKNNSKESLL